MLTKKPFYQVTITCLGLLFITNIFSHAQQWVQKEHLKAHDRTNIGAFGDNVVLSGQFAFITATEDNGVADGKPGLYRAGAVYVFFNDPASGWRQVQKIYSPDRRSSEYFGLEIAANGAYLAVSSNFDEQDSRASNTPEMSGSIYLFKKDLHGTWNFFKRIAAPDRYSQSHFGASFAMHSDYLVALAGKNNFAGQGSAYIYKKDEGGTDNWGLVKRLTGSDQGDYDPFGSAVAFDGNTIVIGAKQEGRDATGGNTLYQAGAVYLFERNAGGPENWGQIKKLIAPVRAAEDAFGFGVDISGGNIVVTAPYDDENEQEAGTLAGSGSAYLFSKNTGGSGNWGLLKKITAPVRFTNSGFGTAIALEGRKLLVGSPWESMTDSSGKVNVAVGATYLYEDQNNDGNWIFTKKIVPDTRYEEDAFGLAVAVEGSNMLIGNPGEDNGQPYNITAPGSAYAFSNESQYTLETDRLALIALYNATNGSAWLQNAGWNPAGLPGESPCGWYGVTCEGGRVTGLNLLNSGLDGNLPAEIGNLDQLKTLVIGWTALTNARLANNGPYLSIPAEIGNLTNLEYLDLSGNTDRSSGLTGGLPLAGSIPASLGNLIKLKYLDLSFRGNDMEYHGYITGQIPQELGKLTELIYLNLGAQAFSGPIPAELGNLTKLQYLELGGANNYTGTIPASFANLVNLQTLDLGYYNCCGETYGTLTGPLPDLSGIPAAANVSISGNSFTFESLEQNIALLDQYALQAKIEGSYNITTRTLSAEAGGNVANNTFNWFRGATLVATLTGTSNYIPDEDGIYHAEVTNSLVPGLTLISENITVAALPVTLVNFFAKSNENHVLLSWVTSIESNSESFIIERSADAKNFSAIAAVAAAGNTNANTKYAFTDINPASENYYRLKQMDFDGKFAYSSVVFAKIDMPEITLYPNPAKGAVYIQNVSKPHRAVIRDAAGKLISEQMVPAGTAVNLTGLMPGLYFISIGDVVHKIVVRN